MVKIVGAHKPVTAAIVVDRWPLLRIGMRRAVHEAGFQLAGESTGLTEGLELQRRCAAGMLVVGDVDDGGAPALRRAAASAVVVALVGQVGREQLVELFGAGVLGIGLRSSEVAEVADLLRRALAGERALVPALLPALVDRDGSGPAPLSTPDGEVRATRQSGELTARERRVLVALAAGASNSEIAAQLYVSQATVKTHLAHIYAKLQVNGRHEALSRAVALGLVH
jgi:DNA-binding NarL/FixJ family response regulator